MAAVDTYRSAAAADGAAAQAVDGAEAPWPSPRTAWTAMALLMLGVFASVLDRSIITLVVEPIKAHFGLTDTQFGALQGLAFGIFYVTAAIPLGMLADRYQRRVVIAVGIAIFDAFSIFTGCAAGYTQLFIARMGVGFGEASLQPCAFSLISDYFPPARLGRAISLFSMCNYVGASMALVVGGALVSGFDRVHAANPASLYGFEPWQATIICCALPGLVLFPFFLLIKEPPRRGLIRGQRRVPLGEMMRELGKRKTALALVIAACTMANTTTQAVTTWLPALFIRVHHWSAGEIGLWLGAVTLVGAGGGTLFGGLMTDRLSARGKLDGPLTVAAYSYVGVVVFGMIAPLMPSGALALLCFAPMLCLKAMVFGAIPTALQLITPNQLRGQVSAIYLTVMNLVGLAAGPVLVGYLSDHLFGGGDGLRYAMMLVTAVAAPLMIVLMLLARRPYREARAAGL